MGRLLVYVLLTVFTLLPIEWLHAQPSPPQNNTWQTYNSSDTIFIFVHGIFSNSADCWTADTGTFWPRLLNQDDRFSNPSIYLGGYFTDFSSGIYRVSNAADELLSYLRVPDSTWKTAPLAKQNIIFVAHSTGGLVVRYMLERYYYLFINVGLVLLASPSRGSEWSNRLKWLRETFNNRMAGQLASDNDFVLDLDSRFADFVQQKRIPRLVGIDAFENKFIVPGFFFNSTHVVSAADSASYFGAYRIIPNTDHFSIAKPTSFSHPSHQLLYEFYETRFKPVAILNPPVVQPDRVVQVPVAPTIAESMKGPDAGGSIFPAPNTDCPEITVMDLTKYPTEYRIERRCIPQ
jgi:pimeloyl-ACP methyl ester carboxylesterase